MKLLAIFVNNTTDESLHSICYNEECEYSRLLDSWNDVSYLRSYLKNNLKYLQSGFYGDISLEDAINEIRSDAARLEKIFYELEIQKNKQGFNKLGSMFQPLSDSDYEKYELKKEKFKHYSKTSKIRLYAIRVSDNAFVITGGAIKLTKKMEDHPDTTEELTKLKKVVNWLKANNIHTQDDLFYYYEEQGFE